MLGSTAKLFHFLTRRLFPWKDVHKKMGIGLSGQDTWVPCVRGLYARGCDYHISGDWSKFSEVIMMISLLVAVTLHY